MTRSKSSSDERPSDSAGAKIRLLVVEAPERSVLLVEGVSDEKFWCRFVERRLCRIVRADSKKTLLMTMANLVDIVRRNVLAIADLDLDWLDSSHDPQTDVVFTDTRDLESLLVRYVGVRELLKVLGNHNEVDTWEEKSPGCSLEARLLEMGMFLGKLRWILQNRHGHPPPLQLQRWMSRDGWSLDLEGMSAWVAEQLSLDQVTLNGLLDALPSAEPLLWCRGHDLCSLIGAALRGIFRSEGGKSRGEEDVQSHLMVQFKFDHLKQTTLYGGIRRWEVSHSPLCVLDPKLS